MRKIPALGRSTHLRKLSELYLGQKYDYCRINSEMSSRCVEGYKLKLRN